MDFSSVLEKCGGFGRYQILMLLLYGYTNILSSMHYYAQTIITFTPEHWCHHEALENLTVHQIREIYSGAPNPSCTSYETVESNETEAERFEGCDRWIYNYEQGYQSVPTELNWVCDRAYQSAVGQSLFFVGSVFGTVLFGFLADRIGRLPALILSSITGALGDFITSFIRTLPAFAASRFISGLSTDTMFYLMYIMVFEYLKPSRRTFGLNVVQIVFYTSGVFMAPWLAIWLGSWRRYLLLASLPALGTLVYPLVLCESAQWLITRKDIKGATKCMRYVAKINRCQVEEQVFEEFEAHYQTQMSEEQKMGDGAKETFMGMFRTPQLRKYTIILFLKSMIITLTLDIVSRNMEGLGISPFKLFSFSALAYVPAGLTIIWLQRYVGRKGMACGSLLVGGITTALTGFMIAFLDSEEYGVLVAMMVALGRYGTIVAYDAEAQYAAEIIPTSVRGQGVANVHVVGYLFNFLSAYIIFLGNYFRPLPSIFLSVIMLMGAALCLALPETMDRKLPENLAEGEEFGKDEKWSYFTCLGRRDPDIETTKL